jgi:peptidoglycan/xylan/chitin deacetylase (PgdA/CDA1 family)
MIERILGHDVVFRPASAVSGKRLRVLAYHGVPEAETFADQVQHLVDRWHPVSAQTVIDASQGGPALPERSVWLTFDDGLSSTVGAGAEVLARFGIEATAFVNPGAVGRCQWWEVVEAVEGIEAVRAAKKVDDDERREIVARADERLDPDTRRTLEANVASLEDLHRWVEAGHTIGNHTWDHPCLDRCHPDEQLRQVDEGGRALIEAGLMDRRLFAYPNGNWSPLVDDHLRAEGYDLALLFDHHLARLDDPLAVSRLRVDAAASPARFKSILSGVQPALQHARDRVRGSGQSS